MAKKRPKQTAWLTHGYIMVFVFAFVLGIILFVVKQDFTQLQSSVVPIDPAEQQAPGSPVSQNPVAVTGPDRTVTKGEIVTLDASNSHDNDGRVVSVLWEGGNDVVIHDPTNFITEATTPDKTGTFVVHLTVTDNSGKTNTATMFITTVDQPVGIPPELYYDIINSKGEKTSNIINNEIFTIKLSSPDAKYFGILHDANNTTQEVGAQTNALRQSGDKPERNEMQAAVNGEKEFTLQLTSEDLTQPIPVVYYLFADNDLITKAKANFILNKDQNTPPELKITITSNNEQIIIDDTVNIFADVTKTPRTKQEDVIALKLNITTPNGANRIIDTTTPGSWQYVVKQTGIHSIKISWKDTVLFNEELNAYSNLQVICSKKYAGIGGDINNCDLEDLGAIIDSFLKEYL